MLIHIYLILDIGAIILIAEKKCSSCIGIVIVIVVCVRIVVIVVSVAVASVVTVVMEIPGQ